MFSKKEFDPRRVYRYDFATNTFYIDIQLDVYREIYSEWDFSPLYSRDMDSNLIEYLEDCFEEIPRKANAIIVFNLPEALKNSEKERKSRISLANYFRYLIRKKNSSRKKISRKAFFYFFLGILFILAGIFLEPWSKGAAFSRVLTEGISVGAWVLFWETFSIFFFSLSEISSSLRLYKRMAAASVEYHYKEKIHPFQ